MEHSAASTCQLCCFLKGSSKVAWVEDKSPAGFTMYTVDDMSTGVPVWISRWAASPEGLTCLAATAAAHANDGALYALQYQHSDQSFANRLQFPKITS